jgi:hypothetical protein
MCNAPTLLDPNRKLWNIGGKSVWEIFSDPAAENLSAIIIDEVNLNDKYQLDGSFVCNILRTR